MWGGDQKVRTWDEARLENEKKDAMPTTQWEKVIMWGPKAMLIMCQLSCPKDLQLKG